VIEGNDKDSSGVDVGVGESEGVAVGVFNPEDVHPPAASTSVRSPAKRKALTLSNSIPPNCHLISRNN
jgi:hypothetical protein